MPSIRGTASQADGRAMNKTLRSTRFPASFSKRLQVGKVNRGVVSQWIEQKITELLGFEDEIVQSTAVNLFLPTPVEDGPPVEVDPRKAQVDLAGFLGEKEAAKFASELWDMLLDAQEAAAGIPRKLVEAKKKELDATRNREPLQQQQHQQQVRHQQQQQQQPVNNDHNNGRGSSRGAYGPPVHYNHGGRAPFRSTNDNGREHVNARPPPAVRQYNDRRSNNAPRSVSPPPLPPPAPLLMPPAPPPPPPPRGRREYNDRPPPNANSRTGESASAASAPLYDEYGRAYRPQHPSGGAPGLGRYPQPPLPRYYEDRGPQPLERRDRDHYSYPPRRSHRSRRDEEEEEDSYESDSSSRLLRRRRYSRCDDPPRGSGSGREGEGGRASSLARGTDDGEYCREGERRTRRGRSYSDGDEGDDDREEASYSSSSPRKRRRRSRSWSSEDSSRRGNRSRTRRRRRSSPSTNSSASSRSFSRSRGSRSSSRSSSRSPSRSPSPRGGRS